MRASPRQGRRFRGRLATSWTQYETEIAETRSYEKNLSWYKMVQALAARCRYSIGGPDLTDHLRCIFFSTTKVPTARHCEAATLRLALLQVWQEKYVSSVRLAVTTEKRPVMRTKHHLNSFFYCSFEDILYPMLASKTVELLPKAWPPVWRPKHSLESTCHLILSTKCIQEVSNPKLC